jgi:hypothetical protein
MKGSYTQLPAATSQLADANISSGALARNGSTCAAHDQLLVRFKRTRAGYWSLRRSLIFGSSRDDLVINSTPVSIFFGTDWPLILSATALTPS